MLIMAFSSIVKTTVEPASQDLVDPQQPLIRAGRNQRADIYRFLCDLKVHYRTSASFT